MLTSKKLSRKVNYDKLVDLFEPGGGMRSVAAATEPVTRAVAITSESGPSRAASRAGVRRKIWGLYPASSVS